MSSRDPWLSVRKPRAIARTAKRVPGNENLRQAVLSRLEETGLTQSQFWKSIGILPQTGKHYLDGDVPVPDRLFHHTYIDPHYDLFR